MKRCHWAEGKDELYQRYHDEEWGVAVYDDQKLFEFIVLESAQAGLSWQTILNKREGYRKAFKNFDPKKVAKLTETEIEKILLDPGIVRNRLKVRATVSNAEAFLKIQKEFGSFSKYMWDWVEGKPIQHKLKTHTDIPVTIDLAVAMAKNLKKRGFKFLGPTVWYAHMQAVGMVNDHTRDCFRYHK
jgi:DNA-3-methyladenine glycosylase I